MELLTKLTLVIVDDSIIHEIFTNNPELNLVMDYLVYKGFRFHTTQTLFQKTVQQLKEKGKSTDPLNYFLNILTTEPFDCLEENYTSSESVIEYCNTSAEIWNVFFLTEKDYQPHEIAKSVTVFKINEFAKLLRSDLEFMEYIRQRQENSRLKR